MEHELIHILMFLFDYTVRGNDGIYSAHGKLFQCMAHTHFGHTEFHHEMGLNPDRLKREDVRPGMFVRFTRRFQGDSEETKIYGRVVELLPKRASVREIYPQPGREWRASIAGLVEVSEEEIPRLKRELPSTQSKETLKSSTEPLKVGDYVKITRKVGGSEQTAYGQVTRTLIKNIAVREICPQPSREWKGRPGNFVKIEYNQIPGCDKAPPPLLPREEVMKKDLQIGDLVSFNSAKKSEMPRMVHGVVSQLLPKNVRVEEIRPQKGRIWTVNPRALTKEGRDLSGKAENSLPSLKKECKKLISSKLFQIFESGDRLIVNHVRGKKGTEDIVQLRNSLDSKYQVPITLEFTNYSNISPPGIELPKEAYENIKVAIRDFEWGEPAPLRILPTVVGSHPPSISTKIYPFPLEEKIQKIVQTTHTSFSVHFLGDKVNLSIFNEYLPLLKRYAAELTIPLSNKEIEQARSTRGTFHQGDEICKFLLKLRDLLKIQAEIATSRENRCSRNYILASINGYPYGGVIVCHSYDHPDRLLIGETVEYPIPKLFSIFFPEKASSLPQLDPDLDISLRKLALMNGNSYIYVSSTDSKSLNQGYELASDQSLAPFRECSLKFGGKVYRKSLY
jgi:hypothetical protein